MKISILKSIRGVTLIELVVTMLIGMVVMGAVTVTYINSTRHYARNREMAQTQMRSRLSVDYIGQEFRNVGYLTSWDTAISPLLINQPITGAAPDAGTDSITLFYALGPIVNPGARVTNLTNTANQTDTSVVVNTLDFDGNPGNDIAVGSLIAIYSPPATANVRQVTQIAGTTLSFPVGAGLTTGFPAGSIVALVQQTSFWIEGGSLMMSTTPGVNQTLAANVEDLQVALMTKNQGIIGDADNTNNAADDNGVLLGDNPGGLTAAQMREVRAMRLSLTGRSTNLVQNRMAMPPPSLEDRDRSGEAVDQFLREVQQTTVYLRNLGVLDP